MEQQLDYDNYLNEEGVPAGGYVTGLGLNINWQNGALVHDGERKEPNGAFVESVIAAAKQRLEHYQTTRFECTQNAMAIEHLNEALTVLRQRTEDREERGVEGTHEI